MRALDIVKNTSASRQEEAGGDVYVSAAGDDRNPGTIAAPFRTLGRARDAVLEVKSREAARPITVVIRGGTYDLERSVVFGSRDSGSAAGAITYRAYAGEKPVFRGGRAVTGWQPFRAGIFVAQLAETEDQHWRVMPRKYRLAATFCSLGSLLLSRNRG